MEEGIWQEGEEGGREGGSKTLRLIGPHVAATTAESCLDLVGNAQPALAAYVGIHAAQVVGGEHNLRTVRVRARVRRAKAREKRERLRWGVTSIERRQMLSCRRWEGMEEGAMKVREEREEDVPVHHKLKHPQQRKQRYDEKGGREGKWQHRGG